MVFQYSTAVGVAACAEAAQLCFMCVALVCVAIVSVQQLWCDDLGGFCELPAELQLQLTMYNRLRG